MRARAGASLLEAVFALAIVGTVAVSALAAAAQQTSVTERAMNLLAAATVAERELAEYVSLSPAALRGVVGVIMPRKAHTPYDGFRISGSIARSVRDTSLFDIVIRVDATTRYELATSVYRPVRLVAE